MTTPQPELAPFPANYPVLYEVWFTAGKDELNNDEDAWRDPETRMVIGYTSRRIMTEDGVHAVQDEDNVRLAVPPDFTWGPRDLVTLPDRGKFQVKGTAEADHGFHGWRPGLILEIQRVEG